MLCKISGVRRMDYTNSKGRHVQGYNVHAQHKDPEVEGLASDEFFVSDRRAAATAPDWAPCLGDKVIVSFNQKGYIDQLTLLDDAGVPVVPVCDW